MNFNIDELKDHFKGKHEEFTNLTDSKKVFES